MGVAPIRFFFAHNPFIPTRQTIFWCFFISPETEITESLTFELLQGRKKHRNKRQINL